MSDLDGTNGEHSASPRALRFDGRLRGEREPTFAELVRQQEAARSADENGERLAMTVALLQAKPALDRELNGARLQQLAQALGDELLDTVRDADVSDIAPYVLVAFLPPAPALSMQGERLLSRVGEDAQIAGLAKLAIDLVQRSQVSA